LILAVLHAVAAYALDSRLVLSVSLTSLAGWFGVEGPMQNLLQANDPLRNSGFNALACASTLFIWRELHRRLLGTLEFKEVLEHFAANLGFWGALALCSSANTRLVGLVILILLAFASVRKGLQNSEELFVIYGIVYGAIGLCVVEAHILADKLSAAVLELATVTAAVIVLWRFRHRMKAAAE
jgi:hypothetical protein